MGSQFSKWSYLFANYSLINHSCNPNSFVTCVNEDVPDPYIRVVTWIDVKKGEELTVNYFSSLIAGIDGTGWIKYAERQQMIKQKYKFDCKCKCCLKGSETDNLRDCMVSADLEEDFDFYKSQLKIFMNTDNFPLL